MAKAIVYFKVKDSGKSYRIFGTGGTAMGCVCWKDSPGVNTCVHISKVLKALVGGKLPENTKFYPETLDFGLVKKSPSLTAAVAGILKKYENPPEASEAAIVPVEGRCIDISPEEMAEAAKAYDALKEIAAKKAAALLNLTVPATVGKYTPPAPLTRFDLIELD